MTKLREMRLLRKINQKTLASMLRVKPPTVNAMERKGIYDTRIAKRYALA